jgi:hypothetical protein
MSAIWSGADPHGGNKAAGHSSRFVSPEGRLEDKLPPRAIRL